MESISFDRIDANDPEGKTRLLFVQELGFFEVLAQLAKKTKVFLTIPETFICGFGFAQPTLLCTDYESGELFVRENVTKIGIYESCAFFEELSRAKGHIPIAVHKVATTVYYHDTCKPLFTPQEATTAWNQHIAQNRSQVMQRFITGLSKHASLIRATWDAASSRVKKMLFKNHIPLRSSILGPKAIKEKRGKKDDRAQELVKSTYLVLTKTDQVMSAEMPVSHTIDSKVMYLISLLERHFLPSQEFKLYNLEVDFIQDEKGFWCVLLSYLINLKSFKLTKHMNFTIEPTFKQSNMRKSKSGVLKIKKQRNQSDDDHLPRIKQWNKAIQKQQEIVTLVETRELRRINRSAIM